MRIRDILRRKGHEVVTIGPDRTVLDAVRLLVDRNIGSLVVVEDETVRGIITERDVLRHTARHPDGFDDLLVEEVMTRDIVTGTPGDQIRQVMQVMTENRIRHLPIVGSDGLDGLVSIGDLVHELLQVTQKENDHLKRYIQGSVY